MAGKPAPFVCAIAVPALCARSDGSGFHAVTVDLSTGGLRLRTTVPPRADEALTCAVRGVGAIEACVAWAGDCDFVVRVTGGDLSPGEVVRRLLRLASLQKPSPHDVRVHRRVTPRSTAVPVVLADGARVAARILDLSASGVALALDPMLAIGDEIAVGRRQATVVRLTAVGIGARFAVPLDDAALGEASVSN